MNALAGTFGAFLLANSLWMLLSPRSWQRVATAYIRRWWMHPAEVALTLVAGCGMVGAWSSGAQPAWVGAFGAWILVLSLG